MSGEFIEFLALSGAVKFGDFTLKSGRNSPFFISTGVLSNGGLCYRLSQFYAQKIAGSLKGSFDALYGPAYKGIPLAVGVAIALYKDHNMNVPYVFDRKEKKLHGDASGFVGAELDTGSRYLILDDVLTTGQTKIEALEKIERGLQGKPSGILIAVDRMERGERKNAIEEFVDKTGVPVHSIVNIQQVFDYLRGKTLANGTVYVTEEIYKAFEQYKKKYW